MKNILITGTNGFIGKSLAELLDKTKYNIIPISRPSPSKERTIYQYDLADESDVDEMFGFFSNIDVVIHCASVGGRRNRLDNPYVFATNVSMFNNLVKHKNKYERIITFGSGAADSSFPLNFYALSKKWIEEKIMSLPLPVDHIKIWGCFGKYEDSSSFIKANILRYLNKEDMIIDCDIKMDFIYVNDLIPLIEDIMMTEESLYYNYMNLRATYSSGERLKHIAELINTLDNYKVGINIDDKYYGTRKDYINYSQGMSTRFNKSLIGLEKGIQQMYNELKNGV